MIDASPPTLQGRRVFLIDGTTMKLAPERELQKAFPPAPNQHGPGVWPVALLAVAHELSSGAAPDPEIGAKFGPEAVSETALAKKLMQQMPAGSVVVADSGFGIFAVAHDAAQAGHSFLFRLTQQRFNAYRKRATLVGKGERSRSYELRWQPSAQEWRSHPEIAKDKLPNRPAKRQYEREAYPRRPKANQFKKRKRPTPRPVAES